MEAQSTLGGRAGVEVRSEGGVLTGVQLVKEGDPGRYGRRPDPICTSLRFEEIKLGRRWNLFFCESHLIYNNKPPGDSRGGIRHRKMPCLGQTGDREHQQSQPDIIQEADAKRTTITR